MYPYACEWQLVFTTVLKVDVFTKCEDFLVVLMLGVCVDMAITWHVVGYLMCIG